MAREFGPVTVQGRALHCLLCGHSVFWEHRVQLTTPFFSFLDPDSTAHAAICERCGYVHMFVPTATVPDDQKAPGGAAPQAA
jgi:predicted nucleic-acid-binding Zn-ribbon protein